MQSLTGHFLFNLSLLIVLLFFCLMWYESVGNRFYKGTAVFYFTASLILCCIFAYPLNEEMVLDLRIIPFLIGGLYLGLSPLLGLLLIIIRGFLGIDIGFWLAVAFYGVFSYFIWRISPWFLKLSSRCRIFFSVGVTMLMSFLMTIGIEILASPSQTLDLWFAYLFVPPLGVAMISYIIENIEKNIYLRQRLVKSEKLEAVEQMGAAISHEIRNPLTSAIGFAQLLQDPSLERNKRTEYLSILQGELESAENVIQDYLTFSKPLIEKVEELDVQGELKRVINLLEPLANQQSVKITSLFSTNAIIEGDRQKFHQCFVNVLKNAIESMPNGGEIKISTVMSLTNIIIRIKDTGEGMTKEQLARLGEPYYSTKGTKGTGLGVMVVYSIVRAMKGTIEVRSKVGRGTSFQFSFKEYKPIAHIQEINNEPSILGFKGNT